MNHFNNGAVADVNMSDRSGYVILDASIGNDESMQVV